MLSLALTALTATLLTAGGPAPAAGPAGLCHALDIGDAASLPWIAGEDWGRVPGYDSERLLDDVMPVLEGTDDLLVHMETLRRAVIYCDAEPEGFDAADHARAAALVEALEARVDALLEHRAAHPDEEPDPVLEARLKFDHRFARTVASVRGFHMGPVPTEDFGELLELVPDDGTLAFGAAVAAWSHAPHSEGWRFMAATLRAPRREDGLVLANALELTRRLFDVDGLVELERRVAREVD